LHTKLWRRIEEIDHIPKRSYGQDVYTQTETENSTNDPTPPNPKDRKNNYPLVNWIEADLNELAVGCKGGFKYNK